MPIRLTDAELDAVMAAARPLALNVRDAFLQHVADALAGRSPTAVSGKRRPIVHSGGSARNPASMCWPPFDARNFGDFQKKRI